MCLVAPSGEMIWQLWQFQVKAQWILVILMLLIVTPVIGCYCKFIVIRQIGADVTMVATINKQNCKIYKKIMFSGAHARLQSWYMISFYEYLWSSLAHCSHRGIGCMHVILQFSRLRLLRLWALAVIWFQTMTLWIFIYAKQLCGTKQRISSLAVMWLHNINALWHVAWICLLLLCNLCLYVDLELYFPLQHKQVNLGNQVWWITRNSQKILFTFAKCCLSFSDILLGFLHFCPQWCLRINQLL